MTPEAFEAACLSLTGTSMVVQWGGAHVYKVGERIFALISSWGGTAAPTFSFKVSDMAYELLVEQGLARPAPYLARAKWVQLNARDSLPAEELSAYLRQAHALVAQGLSRKARVDLGLI